MGWTLCTSGSAIHRAGANANATIVASGSALLDYSNEAEQTICSIARYDVVTNYSLLTAQGKQILQQLAAALVAEDIINYQPSAYSTGEAISILNVLETKIKRNIELIAEQKVKKYLTITNT